MTNEELDAMKYKICCPMCDNYKCVRGTEKCEAELWKKWRIKQRTNEEYAEELRNRALSDYERLNTAIDELERQMTPRKNHETTAKDCISRQEALKCSHIEYDDDGVGHRVIYAEDIEKLPPVTPKAESEGKG